VLKEFFTDDPDDYMFSPVRAREERFAKLRAVRKSSVQPSQLCRRKPNPKRRPRACFTGRSYANAIQEACERAGLAHWAPNQLLHAFATEIRKRFGLEAAQVGLGHAKADVTQVFFSAFRNISHERENDDLEG
jgi:hypothetical protein